MNEIFDKLILRMAFTLFMCFILVVYKYAHMLLYPTSRLQIFKRFYPSKNSADSLHLFSRILGIGIIFSQFYFHVSDGFLFAIVDFFIKATLACAYYLISIYILESIVLYNFEYHDEIVKRKNMAYATVGFAHSLGLAFALKAILAVSQDSLLLMFFLWLFTIVLVGFATKTFVIMSKLPFNRLLVQKNLGLAFSYTGFIWGWIALITSSINLELTQIKWYAIQVILKILLSLIILPVFIWGIKSIFKLQDDLDAKFDAQNEGGEVEFGYGLFEGLTFFTSCFLTMVITGQINFGTFYPVF
jgi:hypothetical protein